MMGRPKMTRPIPADDREASIPVEIDVLTLKLNAVFQLFHEAGGVQALERCGADVKNGIYDLIGDLVSELRDEVASRSEFKW